MLCYVVVFVLLLYYKLVGMHSVSLHSKKEVVILNNSLSCWLQMSEPVSCMDTVNC